VNIDQQTFIYFGCIVAAVILHEISHGVVALWFGDRTAKDAGRLTLNPVPHIDPFGSIVLPAMGAIIGIPVLAWAKPVPVNSSRLRNPRRDMLFVSLAGPTTNFVLMVAAALAAHVAYLNTAPVAFYDQLPIGIRILFSFAVVNLFLGLFNLLPIPPLDGSALIERVLPGSWLPQWYKFRPYGFLVLFLLVFSTGIINQFLDPFETALFNFVFR
jgi:Zn-dependent protease